MGSTRSTNPIQSLSRQELICVRADWIARVAKPAPLLSRIILIAVLVRSFWPIGPGYTIWPWNPAIWGHCLDPGAARSTAFDPGHGPPSTRTSNDDRNLALSSCCVPCYHHCFSIWTSIAMISPYHAMDHPFPWPATATLVPECNDLYYHLDRIIPAIFLGLDLSIVWTRIRPIP